MQEPRVSHVEESDPDAFRTAFIGVVGTILVVVVVVFVQGLYERRTRAEYQRKVVQVVPRELRELRVSQLEKFQPRWIDRQAGIVAISIDDAIVRLLSSPDPAAPVAAPAASGK